MECQGLGGGHPSGKVGLLAGPPLNPGVEEHYGSASLKRTLCRIPKLLESKLYRSLEGQLSAQASCGYTAS